MGNKRKWKNRNHSVASETQKLWIQSVQMQKRRRIDTDSNHCDLTVLVTRIVLPEAPSLAVTLSPTHKDLSTNFKSNQHDIDTQVIQMNSKSMGATQVSDTPIVQEDEKPLTLDIHIHASALGPIKVRQCFSI